MSRHVAIAITLLFIACARSPADAHPIYPVNPPGSVVSPRSAPYRVELIDEWGRILPTFAHRGRYYVLGDLGQRYSVRVINPTPRRIEVVISIDGLDAIDGRTADYVHKRGYVVPPYGDVVVDGFRTSLASVATFRFSSVRDSYAGRKGQARNVGVVGVAIFEERAHRPAYIPPPQVPYHGRDVGGSGLRGAPAKEGGSAGRGDARAKDAAPSRVGSGSVAPSAPSSSAEPRAMREEDVSERSGLGTEFGEERSSTVNYTAFRRANPTRPSAIAELRYNDRDGLMALGILIPPHADDEVELRETATPFPGTRFAEPPPPR
ncbi:MAG: hypothetical protein HY698_09070 [Deltaproteobacteria bacterium]|nr:hypothetical protein [Deltaproteobacteria bacterium]